MMNRSRFLNYSGPGQAFSCWESCVLQSMAHPKKLRNKDCCILGKVCCHWVPKVGVELCLSHRCGCSLNSDTLGMPGTTRDLGLGLRGYRLL